MIDVGLKMPKMAEECRVPAMGRDVFHWPEFLALATRLGVDLSRPYRRLVIDMHCDDFVVILLDQQGADAQASVVNK